MKNFQIRLLFTNSLASVLKLVSLLVWKFLLVSSLVLALMFAVIYLNSWSMYFFQIVVVGILTVSGGVLVGTRAMYFVINHELCSPIYGVSLNYPNLPDIPANSYGVSRDRFLIETLPTRMVIHANEMNFFEAKSQLTSFISRAQALLFKLHNALLFGSALIGFSCLVWGYNLTLVIPTLFIAFAMIGARAISVFFYFSVRRLFVNWCCPQHFVVLAINLNW